MSELSALLDAVDPFDNEDASDIFSDEEIREIEALEDVDRALIAVIGGAEQPLSRRFAAVEALLQKPLDRQTLSAGDVQSIARVVALAIPRDRYHNRWGLPGHFLGRLSKRIVGLPGLDIKPLAALLSDDRPLEILGSEAATIQDLNRYRVSDLAAYLIATVQGKSFADARDPAARDPFIEQLRRDLQ